MDTAMQFVHGLLWGCGFMAAVALFRVLLHVGLCG